MGSTVIPVPYYAQVRQNQQTIWMPPNVNNTLQVHFLNALEAEKKKLDEEDKKRRMTLTAIGFGLTGLAVFFVYRALK